MNNFIDDLSLKDILNVYNNSEISDSNYQKNDSDNSNNSSNSNNSNNSNDSNDTDDTDNINNSDNSRESFSSMAKKKKKCRIGNNDKTLLSNLLNNRPLIILTIVFIMFLCIIIYLYLNGGISFN
jgi:hypothetical protein